MTVMSSFCMCSRMTIFSNNIKLDVVQQQVLYQTLIKHGRCGHVACGPTGVRWLVQVACGRQRLYMVKKEGWGAVYRTR
jgi:hypothetical protein